MTIECITRDIYAIVIPVLLSAFPCVTLMMSQAAQLSQRDRATRRVN